MPSLKTQSSCLTLDMKAINAFVASSKGMIGSVSIEDVGSIRICDINLPWIPKFDLLINGIDTVNSYQWKVACEIRTRYGGGLAAEYLFPRKVMEKTKEKTHGFIEFTESLRSFEMNWMQAAPVFCDKEEDIKKFQKVINSLLQAGLLIRNIDIGRSNCEAAVMTFNFTHHSL